jgi:hypothetical protein
MDVVLQLHRDNRITVTERLLVEMLDGTSHCIYRSLRVAARPPVRKAEAPLLKVLEASIDGVPCRTDDLKARFGTQNVGVYLRDGKRQLAPGIHAFTLVYEMTDVIGLDGGGHGLHLPARGRLRLFPCALPLPVAVLGQGSQAGARGAPLFSPPSLPSRLAGRQGKAPSARLSPAQVHYLVNDCELESPRLATLFLSLARKGRCRLSGNAKAGYGIERIEPAPGEDTEPLSREEEASLAALPQGPVSIGKKSQGVLLGVKTACLNALADEFPSLFSEARLLHCIAFAIPLCLLACIQLCHTQFMRCFGPAWPGYPWNAVKLIIALLVSGTLLSFLPPRQNALGRAWKWLRSAALLLAGTFLAAGLFLPSPSWGMPSSRPWRAFFPARRPSSTRASSRPCSGPSSLPPHAVQVPQSCLAEGPDCGPCLLPQGGGGPPAQRAKPAGRRPCPVREAPLLRQRPRARGGRRRAGGLCGRPAWGRLPGHGLCRYRFQQRWRSGRWGSRQRYRQPVAEATA